MSEIPELDLSRLLRFDTDAGRIELQGYRMVLLSACAVGTLRKELIDTLGWERARALLKRFGYAAGLADAKAMAERFPDLDKDAQRRLGPRLHALEGIAKVTWDSDLGSSDLGSSDLGSEEDHGSRPCGEAWKDSFEAEQHLDLLGRSEEPVCWILAGYTAGHASATGDERVIAIETECKAMGHELCRFQLVTASQDPELYEKEEPDYAPQHLPEELRSLHEAIEAKEKTIVHLRSEVDRVRSRGGFVGESRTLAKALDTAQAVAPYGSSVLILGESGTGKELLARFVHDQSRQSEGVFIAVNCSALPESLQEAELFGYAKGAFTGATSPQAGVFEAAHGGTLFLDEVGDLSLTAQTKILRALQEGEIKRLGETRTRKAEPRIVAATHRDLQTMVREGTFREDLYYRLGVMLVHLPPLRERGNDVLILAEHFSRLYSERFGKEALELSHEAAFTLMEHNWPGNVRELENVIQRAVILAGSGRIELEDLPEELYEPGSGTSTAQEPPSGRETSELEQIENKRERLVRALELAEGNREKASALLGMSRTTLWRRMKAFGIDPDT